MTTTTKRGTHDLSITEEERSRLIELLEQVLGETRVEIHRTHTPEYRERVMGEEVLLRDLLAKFRDLAM